MDANELRASLEAILFVSNEPVKLEDLEAAFSDEGAEAITAQLEEIKRTLDANAGGFILEQAAGGWRFATRAEHDPILKKYFSKKGENRLSIAALETLAMVAYRQPITAPEVSDLRGVNSSGVIRTLLERRMIRVSGRKNVVGSPFLYRTTKDFLIHFGLNDIRDLPRLEEFGDLIGESLNEDVVAAIANAEPVDPQLIDETTPITDTTEEAAEDESGTAFEAQSNEHDAAQASTDQESVDASELESSGSDQQRE